MLAFYTPVVRHQTSYVESDTCHNSVTCLVTANSTTVVVIHCSDHYFLLHSHSRSHLGRPVSNGTAVLLKFSSAEGVHHYFKQIHGIATNAVQGHS